jgi:MFS family permease
MTAAIGPRALLTTPSYLRLWLAGGFGNAMRWLEMLVAGIFTFQQTQSALLVAVVTVARTLPLLLLGAITGVIGEALNRKLLLTAALLTMAAVSAVLFLLAASGRIRIWHIALGGTIAGTLWTTEMSVRRRMIGEVVPFGHVGRAIALDTVTGSLTRMIGPLLGGIVFEAVGLGGCYLVSTVLYLLAGGIVAGLAFEQAPKRLDLARIPAEIAEGLAIARGRPVILGVILVTIVTNVFGFSYSAVIAPLGIEVFGASPLLVGVLAAAEPIGAVTAGLAMAAGWLRMDRPFMMIGGSFLFLGALAAASSISWYPLAFALLLIGGLGTAAFSSMQSTLVLTEAPAPARSRVMGLISVCIGAGPLGVLAVGALADAIGPARAILAMAVAGLAALALAARRWPKPRHA